MTLRTIINIRRDRHTDVLTFECGHTAVRLAKSKWGERGRCDVCTLAARHVQHVGRALRPVVAPTGPLREFQLTGHDTAREPDRSSMFVIDPKRDALPIGPGKLAIVDDGGRAHRYRVIEADAEILTALAKRQRMIDDPFIDITAPASDRSEAFKRGLVGAVILDHDKPLAASPYKSYRARSPFGWIMIGAMDDDDARREAARSSSEWRALEIWNGKKYVPVDP